MPNIKVNKFSRSKAPVLDTIPEHSQPVNPEKPYDGESESKFSEVDNNDEFTDDIDDLFADLNNENYVSEEVDVKKTKSEKEKLKLEKEQLKLDIERSKEEERKQMDAIVSTDTVEGFCTDAILGVIGLAENVSTRSRFNITGTAEMLKQQPKFHQLCKQLYIKHKVFSNVPPEMQLIMMIGLTASVASQNNAKRDKVSSFLNQPVKN